MTGERGQGYRQWLAERTVAVVGLARSGVAAARLIRRLGGRVLASDSGARESPSAQARDSRAPQSQAGTPPPRRSEEHTTQLQCRPQLLCRRLLEKQKD